MKKYTVHIIFAVVIIVIAVVIGCKYFNKQDSAVNSNSVATSEPVVTATPEPTPTVEPTTEPTEAPHEHIYTETVTTEATCEADGLKTFTCDCGDTYTEVISAKGHSFRKYVYNEDATYLADGTMTSTCERCDSTKTSTAINTQLKYTFTLIDKTMYAQQSVNVRDLPCAEGEKVGSLSTNEEVWVFMQCVETGWYEIVGDSITGYVSNNYLDTEKVTVSEEGFVTPENNDAGGNSNNSYNIPDGLEGCTDWIPISSWEEGYAWMEKYPGGGMKMQDGQYFFQPDAGDGGEIVGDAVIKPAGD